MTGETAEKIQGLNDQTGIGIGQAGVVFGFIGSA
jgi:hypothetical protein